MPDESGAAVTVAPTPPPPPPQALPQAPEQLKFKVKCEEFSATTSLDSAWQARPFLTGVVKPVVNKLNKRPDKEPVAAELLERVEVDGREVDISAYLKTVTAAEVVPPGTERVELFFGIAPPKELKFTVRAGGSSDVEFKITLNEKFLAKTFFDAVIVPFVKLFNNRVHARTNLPAGRVADG